MNKKIIALMTLLIVVAVLFCGCNENFSYGPIAGEDYSAEKVIGNGGMAVTQGNYLYFINGVSNYTDDNTFGQVVKGSIMRYTLDANGKISGDPVTIVPKKVFSSSANAGIYVYGEWIYYVTPSNVTDNEGVIQTSYIEFYRTKTDGTSTQMILRLKGNSTEYAFSRDALCYYLDGTLYSVKLDGKFETSTISEDVTSYMFPRETEYDSTATTKDADEYVYYIKAAEKENESHNELWVASMDGSFNQKMIGKLSYFSKADQEKYENPTTPEEYPDYSKVYTFTLKKYANGVLYYSKQYYENGTATDAGVFSYNVEADYINADAKFDAAKEVKYTSTVYSTVYPSTEANELIVSDGSKLWLVSEGSKTQLFPSNVTVFAVRGGYMYYTKSGSNDIYRFKLTDKEEEKESAVKITTSTPDSTWLKAEMCGDFIYYVQPDYDYVYRIDTRLSSDEEGYDVMLGKYSQADLDAIEKAEADE